MSRLPCGLCTMRITTDQASDTLPPALPRRPRTTTTFNTEGPGWASGMSAAVRAAMGGASCAAGPALAEMTCQRRLLAREPRA